MAIAIKSRAAKNEQTVAFYEGNGDKKARKPRFVKVRRIEEDDAAAVLRKKTPTLSAKSGAARFLTFHRAGDCRVW